MRHAVGVDERPRDREPALLVSALADGDALSWMRKAWLKSIVFSRSTVTENGPAAASSRPWARSSRIVSGVASPNRYSSVELARELLPEVDDQAAPLAARRPASRRAAIRKRRRARRGRRADCVPEAPAAAGAGPRQEDAARARPSAGSSLEVRVAGKDFLELLVDRAGFRRAGAVPGRGGAAGRGSRGSRRGRSSCTRARARTTRPAGRPSMCGRPSSSTVTRTSCASPKRLCRSPRTSW